MFFKKSQNFWQRFWFFVVGDEYGELGLRHQYMNKSGLKSKVSCVPLILANHRSAASNPQPSIEISSPGLMWFQYSLQLVKEADRYKKSVGMDLKPMPKRST